MTPILWLACLHIGIFFSTKINKLSFGVPENSQCPSVFVGGWASDACDLNIGKHDAWIVLAVLTRFLADLNNSNSARCRVGCVFATIADVY
jgi:hypothetical protein